MNKFIARQRDGFLAQRASRQRSNLEAETEQTRPKIKTKRVG
jgi:hypothetical protein